MAQKISDALGAGKKVLWLICGGSNILLAKEAMDIVRKNAEEKIKNLTIGQTDERYGEVGHQDSNWQQMKDAGFNFEGVTSHPILFGGSGEETVEHYAKMLAEDFASNDVVIAQFGIGADGHIAGMLPHTGGLDEENLAFGYDSAPFVRITMTPPAFEHIDEAYAFAFGESKKDAVTRLWQKDLTISEMPCQILRRIPESFFYSDQI